MIRIWDMEIKLFSEWRPSAMLNFRKLLFWSCNVCVRMRFYGVHLLSKFRINRPKWRRNIKKRINMASNRYLEFAKFRFSTKWPSWEWKFASATKFDRNRMMVRGWDMEIKLFKMAVVRHLEFSKIAALVSNLCRRVILHLLSKFRVNRPKWHRDIGLSGKRFQYRVRLPSWICKISIFCQIPRRRSK